MIGKSVSHYKILSKIGGGGMGVVYKAEDTKLRRTVALKFLAPELTRDDTAKKRFLHEAQGASALDHPHICSIHEIDETDTGQLFICMAYYEGASLKQLIEEGPLPVSDVFEIAFCMSDALAHAHERGIVHRDLKPANIMITAQGFVKIVDFGLAKLLGRSKVTASGLTLGTVAYMSPEQARGDDVDGRTDVWSLGVVLYEALTGELPFRGEVDHARLFSIIHEAPQPIRELRSEVPEEFARIVDKCLAKDPNERFRSADEMLEALRAMAKKLGWHSSGSLRSVIRVGTAGPRSRIPSAVVALAAIVLILAVPAGWWMWRELHPRTPETVFVTDLRAAVMPLRNLAGDPVSDQFTLGLSEWICELSDLLSNDHESMWVVPFFRTRPGEVTAAEAPDALGVNRLVTGNVQRYGGAYRLSVELLDARSTSRIDGFDIDFAMADLGTMHGRLVDAVSQLFGITLPEERRQHLQSLGSFDAKAFRLGVEGLGYLQRPENANNAMRALEALNEAVATDPGWVRARAALGMAYFREYRAQGDETLLANATEQCNKAVAIDSTSAFAWLQLADIHNESRKWSDAEVAYRRAIDANPKTTVPYEKLAWLYRGTQRVDEAEEACRRMVEMRPDYLYSHIYLGLLLMRAGRTDEALREYETVLSYAPNNAWTLNALGVYYFRQAQWSKAREYYQRSFTVKPDCNTCVNIGIVYSYDEQYAEAAKYFEFSFAYCDSTDPDFFWKWNSWGEALYWTEGRRDEAYPKFREAVRLAERQQRLRPRDPQLLGCLGALYAMLDERDKAIALAEDAAALGAEDGFVLLLVTYTYEKLGERERALHYVAQALRNKFPLERIRVEPMLRDLVQDIRFQQLIEGIEDSSAQRSE